MNEVEKMYENAGVESVGFNPYKLEDEYPPCTAEKQLDIIIFLINRKKPLLFSLDEGQGKISRRIVEEGLAGIVNKLWQDLTEEECKQIKEILNG